MASEPAVSTAAKLPTLLLRVQSTNIILAKNPLAVHLARTGLESSEAALQPALLWFRVLSDEIFTASRTLYFQLNDIISRSFLDEKEKMRPPKEW